MSRIIITLLILIFLMLFLTRGEFSGRNNNLPVSMMSLGFTMIAAFLFGKILQRWKLPMITGYIAAGILIGPYLANLLSVEVVQKLQLIDYIAISLIALTAGGEFRYRVLKKQFNVIRGAIIWQIIIVMAAFVTLIFLFHNQIPFLKNQTTPAILGVGLLFGALATAKSPATTIAIITESKARGPFTDFVLGVTVFKDIIVVLLFSIVLSIAKPAILQENQIQLGYLFSVFADISLSLITGILAGFLILLYLKYVGKEKVIFLLGFVLLGIEVAHIFHLEVVLIFIMAGFFVQNFSDLGSSLIDGIESSSLPIYVIFFTIAGASLNLPIFINNWSLALLIVGLRLLSTYEGTYLGSKLTSASRDIQRFGWMGFVGQAGLTLGLALLVKQNIPGKIGLSISTLIIASIAINQLIGPILFRYSLIKVGEGR